MHTGRPLPQEFATRVLADPTRTVVALHGELDVASAPRVRTVVDDVRRHGATRIVIDLRALEFMDSQGPHVLLDLQATSDDGGPSLLVVPGQRAVQRVFELTRTEPVLAWSDRIAS